MKAQQKRQNASSSASIRSFQSDLERINEDYNKTYTYAGQTSASAMKLQTNGSVRGRRADSVISSAMSDTSEGGDQSFAARKKASRVSFSDVDEGEVRSRNPSPNPKKSAMKPPAASPSRMTAKSLARVAPSTTLAPPGARKTSESSLKPPTPAEFPSPVISEPLYKQTQRVQENGEEDGDLSTIASNSAYGDADEDFRPSPALARSEGMSNNSSVPLTRQNLAAVDDNEPSGHTTPIKSAMKPPSQAGSARLLRNPTESDLDADDESDDSFAGRRAARKVYSKKAIGPQLGAVMSDEENTVANTAANSVATGPAGVVRRPLSRAGSVRSMSSRVSQEPRRMLSLRDSAPVNRRQSLQNARTSSYETQGVQRRASMQSLRAQPPVPAKSVRRGSVAGSIADSVRSEAVNSHMAVMERAQQNVQRLLHGDAADTPDHLADAPVKRSSFERKRPSGLTRRLSSGSMSERVSGMRTSLRSDADISKIKHRRAASDDRAFFNSGADRPRPAAATRSTSVVYTPAANNAAAAAPSNTDLGRASESARVEADATPKKKSRLRSFSFGLGRKKTSGTTTVPADAPVPSIPGTTNTNTHTTAKTNGTAAAAQFSTPPSRRRYSSDSDDNAPRPVRVKPDGPSALRSGTLRSPKTTRRAASASAATDKSALQLDTGAASTTGAHRSASASTPSTPLTGTNRATDAVPSEAHRDTAVPAFASASVTAGSPAEEAAAAATGPSTKQKKFQGLRKFFHMR